MDNVIRVCEEGTKYLYYAPYNATFVQELKALVPYADREWDAGEKCWAIDANYVEEMESLLSDIYPDLDIEYE